MPKRNCESDNFDYISRKLKKLEQKVKECRRHPRSRVIESSSSSSASRESTPIPQTEQDGDPAVFPDACDDSLANIVDGRPPAPSPPPATSAESAASPAPAALENTAGEVVPSDDTLDTIVLDILGDDPTATVQYGNEIHKDLASRFEHLATNGLDKKVRKELADKYLIPANCVKTSAPTLNAEINAALPESMIKRDKAIEARQKQLATAIACLAGAMTDQLNCKEKNHDLIKKLMDTSRLLCDLQHAESTTRRKFAIFAVKRDMKEHLSNTKIDRYLFGENLSEALKAAKSVNKSGIDLKVQTKNSKKPTPHQQKHNSETKNWKPPTAGRKPAAAGMPRTQGPASHRAQRTASSKQSSPPPKTTRRQ